MNARRIRSMSQSQGDAMKAFSDRMSEASDNLEKMRSALAPYAPKVVRGDDPKPLRWESTDSIRVPRTSRSGDLKMTYNA